MIIPKEFNYILNTIRSVAMMNGINVFIVGGFIRDLLLGRQPNDIDILAGSKSAGRKLATLVAKEFGKKPIHFPNHDTSRVHVDNVQIDFSSPHTISLGGTKESCSVNDDVISRDFTVNALLINMKDYSLLDITGRGLSDLNSRTLTFVSEDIFERKVLEDPLTMLRAVRLASTLDLTLDEQVVKIVKRNANKIVPKELGGEVSYQRIAKGLMSSIEDGARPQMKQAARGLTMSKFANKFLAVSEAIMRLQPVLDQGIEAYIAGGFIRDSLLGMYPKDADLTIVWPQFVCVDGGEKISVDEVEELKPMGLIASEQVEDYDGSEYVQYRCTEHSSEIVNGGEYAARMVADALDGDLSITRSKGTAIVSGIATPHGRVAIDFVSARKESYGEDSHKPKIQPGTLEEDVMRRDFTVNTLLMNVRDFQMGMDKFDLEEHVLDITGRGMRDLENGVLETPLNPDETFRDDPTRIVRAIRFAAQKGFKLSSNVVSAIRYGEHDGMLIRDMIIKGGKAPKGSQIGDELKLAILSNPTKTMDLLVKTRLSETLNMGLHDLNVSQEDSRGIHDYNVYGHTKKVVEHMEHIVSEREAEGTSYAPDEKVGLYLAAMMHDVGKAKTKSIVCATRGCDFNIPYEKLERLQQVSNYDMSQFKCPECGNASAKVQFLGHEDISTGFVNNMRGVFSNDILDVVEATVSNHMKRYDPKDSAKTIRNRQREFGRNQEWILMLQEADHSTKSEELRTTWKGQVDEFRMKLSIKTPLTGKDIMDMFNVNPGPDVGLALEQLNMLALRYPQYGIPNSPTQLTDEALAQVYTDANVSTWDELVRNRREAVIEYLKHKSFKEKVGIVDKLPTFNGTQLMSLYGKGGGPWIRAIQERLMDAGHFLGDDELEARNFLRGLELEFGVLVEDNDVEPQ